MTVFYCLLSNLINVIAIIFYIILKIICFSISLFIFHFKFVVFLKISKSNPFY